MPHWTLAMGFLEEGRGGQADRARRYRVAKLIWIFAFVAALSIGAGLPRAAWGFEGSLWHYTYEPNACGDTARTVDPLNIVFVGAVTWAQVDEHWTHHLLWGSTDSGSPQSILDRGGRCVLVGRQLATADADADDRLHARLFNYGYAFEPDGVGTGYHVHVGAHHDLRGYEPFEPFEPCHWVTSEGYNATRNDVASSFTGPLSSEPHRLIAWKRWGNVEPMVQECEGGEHRSALSDGWVPYIDASASPPS